MKISIWLSVLLLGSLLWLTKCTSGEDIYLRVQFDPIEHIQDSAWVRIDNYTFIHTPHDFEWKSNKLFPQEDDSGFFGYLPTSRVFFYHPENREKRVMEKISNFEVCKKLGAHITRIKEDGNFVYTITNPNEYLATSVLKIKRIDNKRIDFSHSEDNPINLSLGRKN